MLKIRAVLLDGLYKWFVEISSFAYGLWFVEHIHHFYPWFCGISAFYLSFYFALFVLLMFPYNKQLYPLL